MQHARIYNTVNDQYRRLRDRNGDYSMECLPDALIREQGFQMACIDTDTEYRINYIQLLDGSWWWTTDGCDVLYGPFPLKSDAIIDAT